MRKHLLGGILLVGLLAAGMSFVIKQEAAAKAPAVEIGGVSLRVEVATTTVAQERGLGGRLSVPEGTGMLFVFKEARPYPLWMKDMLVPIDMIWIDTQGRVVTVAQDVQPASYPHVFYPSAPARYVLETAAGFSAAHGVATGTPVRLKNIPSISK